MKPIFLCLCLLAFPLWQVAQDQKNDLKLLSCGKPIVFSSCGIKKYEGPAYLVDCLTNPKITEKWCATQSNNVVIIDLGKPYIVSKFVQHDCKTLEPFENISNYKIYVSMHDPQEYEWITVVDKKGQEDIKIKTDICVPVKARYIKYEAYADKPFTVRLYEFEAWGKEVSQKDIYSSNELTIKETKRNCDVFIFVLIGLDILIIVFLVFLFVKIKK